MGVNFECHNHDIKIKQGTEIHQNRQTTKTKTTYCAKINFTGKSKKCFSGVKIITVISAYLDNREG